MNKAARGTCDQAEARERARHKMRVEKPMLLIGSPMCRAYSAWQRINNLRRDPEEVKKELENARMHLEFCIELYREHAGR